MKFFIQLAAFGLAVAYPVTAQAQDASVETAETATSENLELARVIIDLGFPPEAREETFRTAMEQVGGQIAASVPELQDDTQVMALVESAQAEALEIGMATLDVHMDAMMEAMAVSYADTFSGDELQALHGFLSSTEGAGFIARMAETNAHPAFAAANQAYLNDYMRAVQPLQRRVTADIVELLVSREAKN